MSMDEMFGAGWINNFIDKNEWKLGQSRALFLECLKCKNSSVADIFKYKLPLDVFFLMNLYDEAVSLCMSF